MTEESRPKITKADFKAQPGFDFDEMACDEEDTVNKIVGTSTTKIVKRYCSRANAEKVVVIGAGISGLTTAYYAAKGGAKVTVVDKADTVCAGGSSIGSGAFAPSWISSAIAPTRFRQTVSTCYQLRKEGQMDKLFDNSVWTSLGFYSFFFRSFVNAHRSKFGVQSDQKLRRLAMYSQECWENLLSSDDFKEFNPAVQFFVGARGSAELIFQDELKGWKTFYTANAMATIRARHGFPTVWLNRPEVSKIVPMLQFKHFRKEMLGGVVCKSDSTCDISRLGQALKKVCEEKYDVEFMLGYEVKKIHTEKVKRKPYGPEWWRNLRGLSAQIDLKALKEMERQGGPADAGYDPEETMSVTGARYMVERLPFLRPHRKKVTGVTVRKVQDGYDDSKVESELCLSANSVVVAAGAGSRALAKETGVGSCPLFPRRFWIYQQDCIRMNTESNFVTARMELQYVLRTLKHGTLTKLGPFLRWTVPAEFVAPHRAEGRAEPPDQLVAGAQERIAQLIVPDAVIPLKPTGERWDSSVRLMTCDDVPVIGETREVRGLFLNCGGGEHSQTLAFGAGALLAPLLLGPSSLKESSSMLVPDFMWYSPQRFSPLFSRYQKKYGGMERVKRDESLEKAIEQEKLQESWKWRDAHKTQSDDEDGETTAVVHS